MNKIAKVAFATATTVLMATSAYGACKEDFFSIQDFSYHDAGEQNIELAFTLQSLSQKPVRMIDAQFGFKDALGGMVGSMKLQRDVKIDQSGAYAETGKFSQKTFERLLNLDRADIVPFTCVKGVIYEDGTKEQF